MTIEQIREFLKSRKAEISEAGSAGILAYDPDVSIVVVDPGHGGSDPGAVGYLDGDEYHESDINLEISLYLQDYLESDGYTVYMTRTTDEKVSLTSRYTLANNVNADAFISVHCNSSTNTSANGVTCIYPNNHDIDYSQDLALWVHDCLLIGMESHATPYKDNRNLAVLRNTDMPAIITENGFMSNTDDLALISDPDFQDLLAIYIYVGLYMWDTEGEF